MFKIVSFIILSFLCPVCCLAQLTKEKITVYLHTSKFPIDTEASAVVLYEDIHLGIGEEQGRYVQTKTVYRTVKILKKDELKMADVTIYIPKEDYANYVYKITGRTYNLSANEVRETPLPKNDVYQTKLVKDFYEVKFTMPEVKEGSVIDYSYNLVSPLYDNPPPWRIEEDIPKLLSIYSISYPANIAFKSVSHVKSELKHFNNMNDAINSPDAYCEYTNTSTFSGGINSALWVRKNVRGVKNEPFITNIYNNKERLDLMVVHYNGLNQKTNTTWQDYNDEMWRSEFAKAVRQHNLYLDETINDITKGYDNDKAKAKAIFTYIRQQIKIIDRDDLPDADIKEVFNEKKGTSLQVNLLLIAMLNNAGLNAYMLRTSTTNYTSASPDFPMFNNLYNVVCALSIDSSYILMDAGNPNNVFGILPTYCYNGYSRVITKEGDAIILTPNLLEDKTINSLKITFPTDTTEILEFTEKEGLITSSKTRKEFFKENTNLDNYFEHLADKIADNSVILNKKIENWYKPDTNLIIKLTLERKRDPSLSHFFLTTSFLPVFSKNPFVASNRINPIEFSFKDNDLNYLTVVLPPGFTIDSSPKPILMNLEENSMEYSKEVAYYPELNTLTANVTYKNNQVTYESKNYNNIRDFFEQIVKEENKVIEIKKK